MIQTVIDFPPTSAGSSKPGNKVGMGCLILFALPFAGFGTFAAYKCIENLINGKIRDGLFLGMFALVFSGVGYGLIIGSFFGRKTLNRIEALKAAHPDKPWLWREDWASGRIASSAKAGMAAAWVFASFWNIVSYTVFFGFVTQKQHESHVVLLVAIFPLVGLGLLAWAILNTLRWKKFGQSWFKLLANPGVIGGQLSGGVETSAKIRPKEGFRIRLRCVHRDSSGENTNESVLWEDEKTIIKDLLNDPGRSGIPVFFQIPADCSATNSAVANHQTIWRLEVRAKLDGPDYTAQFEVPVFQIAGNTAAAPIIIDPTLPFQAPEQPYQQPAASRIKVRPLPTGGTEFYFPAARNIGPIITLLFFFAIWNTVIWFMVTKHAPILFPIVFGLFDLLLAFGLVSALFKSSSIRVDTAGIQARQNWLVFSSEKRFAASEIISVELKNGMTSGQTVYYDLQAVTSANGTSTLASSIRDKKEAQWLAAEMQRLLKLDNAPASPSIQA
jgi:hypothetical protein